MKRLSLFALSVGIILSLTLPAAALQSENLAQLRRVRPGQPTGTKDGPLRQHEAFGSSLANIGDLDGNGVSDLAVGAPNGPSGGQLWILWMGPNGALLKSKPIAFKAPLLGPGPDARFGSSVAALGDLDQDGKLELAVGAPGEGTVWIMSLGPNGEIFRKSKLQIDDALANGPDSSATAREHAERQVAAANKSQGTRISAVPPQTGRSTGFGQSLAAAGDLDGDGHLDLVVGAPLDADGGPERGAVWIVTLGPMGEWRTQQKISSLAGVFNGHIRDGERFGSALANLGDLDGDGRAEIAVGSPGSRQPTGKGLSADGSVWILFLAKQGGVRHFKRIEASIQGERPALNPGEDAPAPLRFGSSLASLGDLNGDGSADLAVGAPGAGQQGDAWLLLLRKDGSVLARERLADQAPWSRQGPPLAAGLGRAMTQTDDLNGDGLGDLIVSARHADNGDDALWSVLLQSCFSASVSVRQGSGLNPCNLVAEGVPRRGNPWHMTLDCSTDGLGVGSVLGRTRPSPGLFTEAGELLVDLSPSSFAFLLQAPHQGRPLSFSLQIPLDTASCNMTLFVQGLCTSKTGARFSNALDLIIGR